MKLIAAVIMLFALAHAGGSTNSGQPYVVPSCHGLASVPGYERCHN